MPLALTKACLLCVVVLLLIPEGAMAARWHQREVVVEDHTGAAWDGVVEAAVAELNAIMPESAPTFVYLRLPEMPCSQLTQRGRVIAVCNSDTEIVCRFDRTQDSGYTCPTQRGKKLVHARVRLSDWWTVGYQPYRQNLACHELMHAMTGIGDRYSDLPDQSCVWGWLPHPGPMDAVIAARAYRPHHRHR